MLVDSGFMIGNFHITFKVQVKATRWQKSIHVVALLPPEYPETALKQTFGGQVAEAILLIRPDIQRITVIHLRVFSSIRNFLLQRQNLQLAEIQGTKGLGKAILCFAIQQAWIHFEKDLGGISNLPTLMIDLETGATNFYTDAEMESLVGTNRYIPRANLVSKIAAWFPMLKPSELHEFLDRKSDPELLKLYTEHEENRMLVSYYQRTYGFEPVFDDPIDILQHAKVAMEAPAFVVFQNCKI